MPATPSRALLLPALLACTYSASADNLSAHQHGYAELQVAFSGQTVELRALSPAYNLLGFEHKPRSEAEHQAVEETLHWLEENPLITTSASSCTLQSSEVQYAYAKAGERGSDHHDDHDEHHGEHGHDDEHDHGKNTHSDIEVSQTLNCSDLSADSQLISKVSERFPALEHLTIQWSGPDGQGALRLEHGETSFRLTR